MQPPVRAILIGAGDRGRFAYGRYALAHPEDMQIVAVAEPQPDRRGAFAREHGLSAENCLTTWEEVLGTGRRREISADTVLICTQDQLHTAPALAALAQGYHVLLEKPMAVTLDDCRALVAAAERAGRHLQICHVLRYTPFFQAIHAVLQAGRLGDLISLSQRENVSYWHMAHSFVRGNWRRAADSSPMILAKCCHDLDTLFWFAGARTRRLSSFGSLRHFRPSNAPPGAPERCAQGCPAEACCLYSALDVYVRLTPLLQQAQMSRIVWLRGLARLIERQPGLAESLAHWIPPLRQFTAYSGWPVHIVTDDFTRAGRLRAMQDPANPYGRCVYHCDNDVVDHQHVNIEFENGVTATLIMHGHAYADGRTVRLDGTAATVVGHMYRHEQRLELFDKRSGRRELLFSGGLDLSDQHGGGDTGMLRAFVRLVRGEIQPDVATAAQGALESHLMAFSAEYARLTGQVVNLEEWR